MSHTFRLTACHFAALFCILCTPAFSQLKLEEQLGGKAKLRVFGDVKTVLDGQSTGSRFQKVNAGDYLTALGCASVHNDITSQGETLFIGGTAFVKSVDPGTSYATERISPDCWASFLAGLEPNSKPVARYTIETTKPVSLDLVYKILHRKHGALIGIVGQARFSVLELSAVKKAPIYGESIIGPKRLEYFHPTGIEQNADAILFGLSQRSNADATDTTRKVFYVNPADKMSTAGQSHTHCGMGSGLSTLTPDSLSRAAAKIDSVAHVLTQSQLVSGELLVYELD